MRTRSIAATVTALLTATLVACSGSGEPLSESAAVMCEQFVKKNLKSAGSAEFPGVTDADYAKTTTLSNAKPWKYKVTGVVDSDNSFGASVRSDYVCTVSTKDNDTWTLDDLDLTPR